MTNKTLPKGHPLRKIKQAHSPYAGKGPKNSTLGDFKTNEERCPECNAVLIHQEGCKLCPMCGWGLCS